jgi:hypothetical protein
MFYSERGGEGGEEIEKETVVKKHSRLIRQKEVDKKVPNISRFPGQKSLLPPGRPFISNFPSVFIFPSTAPSWFIY